jgi:hypothetical protein
MQEVLAASLAFPAVIFTVVLALALLYWLFVILGALDLDLLGGADADADLDGVVKGALEGAVKGGLEGAAKGAAEGLADAGDGDEHGGLAALFTSLQLTRAPATVVLTILTMFGWVGSVVGAMQLGPVWAGWGLPGWLLGIGLFIASIVVAFPLTSLVVRPLGPFFATQQAKSRNDFIGKECVISTGRVDARFGQATVSDGGAGLIVDVRCDTPGVLRQGDRALLVSWDSEREAFEVEPLNELLDQARSAKTPGRRVEAAPAQPEAAVADPAPAEQADALDALEDEARAKRSQGGVG